MGIGELTVLESINNPKPGTNLAVIYNWLFSFVIHKYYFDLLDNFKINKKKNLTISGLL
jgi:hypothetical protein